MMAGVLVGTIAQLAPNVSSTRKYVLACPNPRSFPSKKLRFARGGMLARAELEAVFANGMVR